ncbi:tyrosine-type recombinase/integrase [Clostridium baratii]|uniref:tyrosine-type recombinase/integrase n=1 Tax=Clostridium baratii TaxID=1561 RepID=UPI00069B7384|nr:tyrosine-type recombinase/integrase [Clostridium baratii]AQM58526.2 hypothetical protein NPD11_3053 [Clostridium baratii]
MNNIDLITIKTDHTDLNSQTYSNNNSIVELFILEKEKNSINTARNYKQTISEFFNRPIQDISYNDLKYVDIFKAKSYVKWLNTKGLKSSTIHNKISALSSLYDWLMQFNTEDKTIISNNHFANLKNKGTIEDVNVEFLDEKEIKHLLKSITIDNIIDIRDKTLLSLAFSTGLRVSDLVNINIKQNIKKFDGQYALVFNMKKVKRRHISKIQPKVKKLIDLYLVQTNRTYESDDYLFKAHRGKISDGLSTRSVSNIINARIKAAGINKHLTPHGTRHSAITMAAKNGVDLIRLKQFAGHKNINTTARYTHITNSLKDNPGDDFNIF